MKLPNATRAFIDVTKLRDYCLNPAHLRGRHKARVFAASMGITAENADELSRALLEGIVDADALPAEKDEYGRRYLVDCKVIGPNGQAPVRSIWMIHTGEDFPRLISCYVL